MECKFRNMSKELVITAGDEVVRVDECSTCDQLFK